ncbi:RNA binding protein [Aspergillus terreus]|uniref:RNA binding protein n=1 Tax=Aspergillus terreus TaxID=33178 RepID=A0A5M3YQB4_ASPTE|nr:hypothetical protein ATETN484_0001066300 [Aspergillus terreus]GFF12519.1 RNA binding protein [Aspergillus terreus]
MLELFQIRDLHGSPSPTATDDTDPSTPLPNTTSDPQNRGIIQISSSDYDQIATTHPRARLTYVDDDDGETITVGSSFELSQRLEDPIPLGYFSIPTFSGPVSTSYPMHIFDIRRSKSVTDLWKKYEYRPHLRVDQATSDTNAETQTHDTRPLAQEEARPNHDNAANPTSATENSEMEPLLAAFEAQMASILRASESLNRASEQQTTATPPQTQETPRSNSTQSPNDAFTCAINNLIDGAEKIRSGVVSRLPEFERQLQNAQRALPEPVGSSVQSALVTLEDQARNLVNALNNAAAARGQGSGNIFQGELPTANEAVSGLRNLASEIGHMGYTLFGALDSEFRGSSRSQGQDSPRDNSVPPLPENTEQAPGPSHETPAIRTESGATLSNRDQDVQTHHAVPHPQSTQDRQAQPSNPFNLPYRPRTEGPGLSHDPVQNLCSSGPSSVSEPAQPNVVNGPPLQRAPTSSALFIGNVGFNVNEKMIHDVFASRGFTPNVNLLRYPGAGQHAGFGYLYFPSDNHARDALEALQGTHIDGHSINLEFSDSRPARAFPTFNCPPPRLPSMRRGNNLHGSTGEGHHETTGSRRTAPLSVADLCSNDHRHVDEATTDGNLEGSWRTNAQRLNALYPSLTPENTRPHPIVSDPPARIPDQMLQFPPFSQQDALYQRAGSSVSDDQVHRQRTPEDSRRNETSTQNLPGSFPQDVCDDLEMPQNNGPSNPLRSQSVSSRPRRGNPVRPARSLRHGHRDRPGWPMDDFRPLSFCSQARPFHTSGGVSRPSAHRQQRIDECVSALASLGYGGAEEGGLQRIAVYAEAVDGRISDAIEMIEEERKAYEQQRSPM